MMKRILNLQLITRIKTKARRWYWQRVYKQMSQGERKLACAKGIDPESLINRGEL